VVISTLAFYALTKTNDHLLYLVALL